MKSWTRTACPPTSIFVAITSTLFVEIIIEILALFKKKEFHLLEEVPQSFLMLISLKLQSFHLSIEYFYFIAEVIYHLIFILAALTALFEHVAVEHAASGLRRLHKITLLGETLPTLHSTDPRLDRSNAFAYDIQS